jgi:two-component system phosphate regulon sensor histidine kinase PhoR
MVVDSGEGIPPQERERIWERFYRVDRARIRGRSGLGLAIVKEIVEAHGGAVGVDSHVGSGSTFWIRLPA